MEKTKVNLLEGLRLKKHTKELLAKIISAVQTYNSVSEHATREIDVLKAIELWEKTKEYLIDLKLKLQDASRPIQRDILMISELKDQLKFYQKLNTKHGVEEDCFGEKNRRREAVIRRGPAEKKCAELQRRLDKTFSKIDAFNASNYIDIEELPMEQFESVLMS